MDRPPVETTAAEGRSLAALVRDVYLAPADAFTELARQPRYAPALVGFVFTQVTFVATWMSRVDLIEFIRAQAEASGRTMPRPLELAPSSITAMKWGMSISGIAFALLILLATAGVLLFVFSFLLGARVTYRQSLTVVAWTAFPTHLVLVAVMLSVMGLRGEWSVPPDQVLQASVAALLDRASTGKFVYSLAQSCDVFTAWILALASLGMARATRLSTSTAAITVVALWGIFVLGKAALSAAM